MAQKNYFSEGQEAFREGKPREANPYEGQRWMSDAMNLWDQGWESEQQAMQGN